MDSVCLQGKYLPVVCHSIRQIGTKEKRESHETLSQLAPPVDLLSNHFYEDLERLYDLRPYLEVVHLHTDMKSNSRSVDGTG